MGKIFGIFFLLCYAFLGLSSSTKHCVSNQIFEALCLMCIWYIISGVFFLFIFPFILSRITEEIREKEYIYLSESQIRLTDSIQYGMKKKINTIWWLKAMPLLFITVINVLGFYLFFCMLRIVINELLLSVEVFRVGNETPQNKWIF